MATTVAENQIGELQEEINTLVAKTNELIATSSVDPSVAALLQSMTVIIKLLAKQNLNVSASNSNNAHAGNPNGPAPLASAPPPPPPIQQLPPLNTHDDNEHRDCLTMPIEINSEIQAKCKEMLEKRRKSVRLTSDSSSSSGEESSAADSDTEHNKRKKSATSDRLKTRATSSTRKLKPKKRSSLSSQGSSGKQPGCNIS